MALTSSITNIIDYIKALEKHDWFYEASSDHGVWKKGMREKLDICLAQPTFDSNFVLWNTHAPEVLRRYPKPKYCPDGEHKTVANDRA